MSTSQTPKTKVVEIADVQNKPDIRHIAIDKVGIKDIRHPVLVKDRSQGVQHTIANFNMYVYLPHNFKGTHMSRFVEILNSHDMEISVESFKGMLGEMRKRLEAERGHIEMSFPYFINKAAPVSGVKSLIDYQVSFVGEINGSRDQMTIKVVVPVTSLCPCSKEISQYGPTISAARPSGARQHLYLGQDLIDLVKAECEPRPRPG
jgi:GTP cyclohydrolase I